jgi:hypothetical protein
MLASTIAIRQHSGSKPGHHADFLNHVVTQETQARASNRPVRLTVQQHAAHRKTLEGVRFIKPKYAAETEINVIGIFGKWKRFVAACLPLHYLGLIPCVNRYCEEMQVGEWKSTIERLTRETMQDFFLWICECHRIKSWGTSLEYIRQFQQLYTTVTGRYPDRNDVKELYKVRDVLTQILFSM